MNERIRKRSFPWKTTLVICLGLGAGAYYAFKPPPPLEVETVRVERGEVREMVASSAAGEVRPARRVQVRAEMAGTVATIPKKAGDRVEAGELIVRFDSADLDARLAQAAANVEAARVAGRIAQTRRESANRGLERAKKLHARQAISDVELDKAETEVRAAEHGIEQARAALAQAQAADKLARVAKDRVTIEAPFGGVLQEVYAEVGVQLAPGSLLFDLIDDSSVYIDVPVDEADIASIFVGQEVVLRTGSQRGEQLKGKVLFIPPAVGRPREGLPVEAAALAQKERSFYVHVAPEDRSSFRVGASVNAEFLVSAQKDVLYIPTQVVLGRGIDRAVYIIEKGRVRKHAFEAGLTSWERTEVRSGLEEGASVVSSMNVEGLDEGVRAHAKSGASSSPAGRGVEAASR